MNSKIRKDVLVTLTLNSDIAKIPKTWDMSNASENSHLPGYRLTSYASQRELASQLKIFLRSLKEKEVISFPFLINM
jgi:hypothetical protein